MSATASQDASMDEHTASFGYWGQRGRKALDLTQADLARRVGCSTGLIRMIEADTRRPSRQIAELLAEQLAVLPAERAAFVKAARGELAVHRLAGATPSSDAPPPRPPPPGPPGGGKPRLALQVAAEMLDDYPNGVFFVNLAPITDPALVAPTIAQTLGVVLIGNQPPLEVLKDHLRERHLLLVLDNFEQVLDAAPQVAALLSAAPALNILVTSRVVLHL